MMTMMLMEKVRSILNSAGLTKELWEESIDTTFYLVNRSPTLAPIDKTHHEVWSNKKHSLAHLGVFGCDPFVHVPTEKIRKLENKVEKFFFIGYKDGAKGYKP